MSSNGIILQNQSGWICHSLTSGVVVESQRHRMSAWFRLMETSAFHSVVFTFLLTIVYFPQVSKTHLKSEQVKDTSMKSILWSPNIIAMKMWLKQITVYLQPQNTLSRVRMDEELWENRSKQGRWLRLPRCYLELWVAIQFIDWTTTRQPITWEESGTWSLF